MLREIPRTLASLSPSYQREVDPEDYEVLVVDNGSSRPLNEDMVRSFGPGFHHDFLLDAPPSPARAINYAADRARGDLLCIMIDGAHLLTPGVLKFAFTAYRAFVEPLVLVRYFYLGPGPQNETMHTGYDQAREDALLAGIRWPEDGYRLFEIAFPLATFGPRISWFSPMLESNCLFLSKRVFDGVGGCDERFDMPGGGFLNIDMLNQVAARADTSLVQLIGEGSFHQIHGGITTNTSRTDQKEKVDAYAAQYRALRGDDVRGHGKPVHFLGHLPTFHSKIDTRFRDLEIPVGPLLKCRVGAQRQGRA